MQIAGASSSSSASARLRRGVASRARPELRMRSRSSAAAFSVNVIAAIERIGTPAVGDQRDDPVDEHRRLAGTGAGLDEQRLVEAFANRVARRLVSGLVEEHELAHASSALDQLAVRRRARARRTCVPTAATRSAVPSPSGSQNSHGHEGARPRWRRHRDEDPGFDAVDDRAHRGHERIIDRAIDFVADQLVVAAPDEPVVRLDPCHRAVRADRGASRRSEAASAGPVVDRVSGLRSA